MASIEFSDFIAQTTTANITTDVITKFRVPQIHVDELIVLNSTIMRGTVTRSTSDTPITSIEVQPNGGFTATLTATESAADIDINFPDPGSNAKVIYDVSDQTITGDKTFSSAVIFDGPVSISGPVSFSQAVTFNENVNFDGNVRTAIVFTRETAAAITTSFTAAQAVAGIVYATPGSGGTLIQVPTAASLVAAVPGVKVGDMIICLIVNDSPFSVRLSTNTGITLLTLPVIWYTDSREVYFRFTNIGSGTEAVSVY